MHQPSTPSLEIRQVNKDDIGPYVKVRVTLADEKINIRFGLDEFTYIHLDRLLHELFKGHFPSDYYKCFLSFETEPAPNFTFTGWVVCQLGAQKTRLSFECSELYISNLQWLKSIDSLADLESLSWEHWIDTYNFENTYSSFEVLEALETIKSVSKTASTQRRYAIIVSVGLALLCALGFSWFGISHRYRFATNPMQIVPVKQTLIAATANTTHTLHKSGTLHKGTLAPYHHSEFYKVPAGDVALTFDDGPTEYTSRILEALSDNHVHATFFFIGENVQHYKSVVHGAVLDGNQVGDHSENHPNLEDMTAQEQSYEINEAAKEIELVTHQPVTMFRPPYEAFNNDTKQILDQNGMTLTLWNEDPEDWKAKSKADVIQRVLSLPASGSVFILHDKKYTAEALPTIIKAFKAEHLKIVLLSTVQK